MQTLIFILYIILALLVLLVMITIHEFGHYLAGKLLKFKINEFSIGFGPKLFSRKNKKTGEVFSLRAVPLGGFCAFEGEDGSAEENAQNVENKETAVFDEIKESSKEQKALTKASESSATTAGQSVMPTDLKRFNDHKPWKRIVVFVAGGMFNILSAIIFSMIFIAAVGLEKPPTITYVFMYENEQGIILPYNTFAKGDQIIEVNGKKLTLMYTINDALSTVKGDTADFTVLRNGKAVPLTANVREIGVNDINTNALRDMYGVEDYEYTAFNGFGFTHQAQRDRGLGTAIKYCVPYTGKMAWLILGAFGKLVTGRVPLSQITGPVGTVTVMAEASVMNWRNILILLPLIAANLGIFNLLPIPALDGSKIVFAGIEWIRKKPVNRKVEGMIHLVGLLLLFGFVIIADIAGMFLRCGV